MICSICGGLVLWVDVCNFQRGSKCEQCGAEDSQYIEEYLDEILDEEDQFNLEREEE